MLLLFPVVDYSKEYNSYHLLSDSSPPFFSPPDSNLFDFSLVQNSDHNDIREGTKETTAWFRELYLAASFHYAAS